MADNVSGSYAFDLSVDDLINTAARRIGGEVTTGIDALFARTALNLLFIDIENKAIPLCRVTKNSLTLVQGTAEYTLPVKIYHVLQGSLKRADIETEIEKISILEYGKLSIKTQQGQPTQFAVSKTRNALTLHFYLVPDATVETFEYWAVERVDDVNAMAQLTNISTRYYPALVSGLAYFMGSERPKTVDSAKLAELKARYDEDLMLAKDTDSEDAPFYARPVLPRIY